MSRPKKKSAKTAAEIPTVLIAYKYRAYPTELQQYRMDNWVWTLGGLHNGAETERKESYRTTGKGFTYSQQQNVNIDKIREILYSKDLCKRRIKAQISGA